MSLGMWKDSALNLAALAKEAEEHPEHPHLIATGEEGHTEEVSLGLVDSSSLTRQTSSTSDSIQADESDHSLPESETSSGLGTEEEEGGKEEKGGQYSGFHADYSEYDNYEVEYPYAPTVLGSKQSSSGNILCCLLAPWFGKKEQDKIKEQYEEEPTEEEPTLPTEAASRDDDDDISAGSEMYGQKITEQERLAVMARLRVSEMDTGHDATGKHLLDETTSIPPPKETTQAEDKNVGLEIEQQPASERSPEKPVSTTKSETPKRKSILKRGSSSTMKANTPATSSRPSDSESAGQRRMLFSATYEKKKHTTNHHARFAPMARVVTIKSCNGMTYVEKSSVWWQKTDYDNFKKAGRLIGKAMIEGGSEIWLTNSSSTKKKVSIERAASDNTKRSYHMSDRSELRQEAGDESSPEDFGNKWWCKFGHSRRGLEHIASMEEGRQRQNNVRLAVRAVLDEQRRQKLYAKEDHEKVRSISLKHTHWARDLALAAGAADAESVRSNFSEVAKSREFYLKKQVTASAGTSRQVPAFMDPSGASRRNLDANTSSQIRFRRLSVKISPQVHPAEEKKSEDVGELEAIHDTPHSSLSRKAAAFGTEAKDMAAVLSGMGAVTAK